MQTLKKFIAPAPASLMPINCRRCRAGTYALGELRVVCIWPLAVHKTGVMFFACKGMADAMMRGARRRRWGWLVAIAYLFASMTPSLASVVPLQIDLPMPHSHEADGHAGVHQHGHADGGSAPHTHDEASLGDSDNDQELPSARHANCCGSVLCFSAISPQTPSLVQFAALHSRCESEPDPIGDAGAFRRHYRPPIV